MKLNNIEIEDIYSKRFGTYFTWILVTLIYKKLEK